MKSQIQNPTATVGFHPPHIVNICQGMFSVQAYEFPPSSAYSQIFSWVEMGIAPVFTLTWVVIWSPCAQEHVLGFLS